VSKTTLALLFITDNVPEMRTLSDVKTMKFNGLDYWVIPVPVEKHLPAPVPAPSQHKEATTIETVTALHQQGLSAKDIARRIGHSTIWVYKRLERAGLQTAGAKLEEILTEILLESDDQGVAAASLKDHPKVRDLYPNGHAPIGPTLGRLAHHDEIKRLPNGNLTVA
jgi:hypothetical protein